MAPKKPKQKPRSGHRGDGAAAPVTTDPRFSLIHSDPRFAPPAKRRDHAVTLDARFRRVLSDPRFSSRARVDRYGRKLPKQAGGNRAELARFYKLDDDDDDDDDDDAEEEARWFDPASGEGIIDTSSSSSEESDSDGDDDNDVQVEMAEGVEAEAQAAEVPTGQVSRRLACVNLDWDNVRAVDLMKAFASFTPSGGKVTKVTVYPSEFGRQRMEREQLEGPPAELFRKQTAHGHGDEEEEEGGEGDVTAEAIVKEDRGDEYDSAKLREYQLERLRCGVQALAHSNRDLAANGFWQILCGRGLRLGAHRPAHLRQLRRR